MNSIGTPLPKMPILKNGKHSIPRVLFMWKTMMRFYNFLLL